MAAQHGVDLADASTGTGVGGRIRKQDVLDAAAKAKQAAGRRAGRRPPPAAGRRRRPRPAPPATPDARCAARPSR